MQSRTVKTKKLALFSNVKMWGKYLSTVGNIIGNPLIIPRFLKVPCVKKLALGYTLMLLMLGMHSYVRSTNILWKASNTPCPLTWIPTSGCWLILIAPQCGKYLMKIIFENWKRRILDCNANFMSNFWKIDVYCVGILFNSIFPQKCSKNLL